MFNTNTTYIGWEETVNLDERFVHVVFLWGKKKMIYAFANYILYIHDIYIKMRKILYEKIRNSYDMIIV